MKTRHPGWPSLALASTVVLTACGGSGDSAPPPPPAGSVLTLTGVVSVGPAVGSAPVQVTCATGTAAATTAADGSYSAGVASGVLPCVLRTTTSTGTLHSVAAGGAAATTATANITPLTELVTANVGGGSPDALYTTFDATAQARVTTTTIATGIASTAAALAGSVDLSAANPLTDKLVATTSGSAGNAANQSVTKLVDAIAATQTTLAAVSQAVSTATPTSPPVLPMLAPRATTCTAFRTGRYYSLSPHETIDDPASVGSLLTVDAAALTATENGPGGDGTITSLHAVAGAPCSFTYAGDFGTGTALVSPGGMTVLRSPSVTGPIRTSFIIPAQDIPLAQLAGSWNFITYQRDRNTPSQALTAANGTVVIDTTGHFTSGTECVGLSCMVAPPEDLPNPMTVDPLGGFDSPDDAGTARVFVAAADNGAKTLFILFPGEGGIAVLTEQRTLALPDVASVNDFWDFNVGSGAFEYSPANNAEGGASPLADYSITVTSVDTVAQSFTRLRASDQRVDTMLINNPRIGVRNRVASGNVQASFSMPLQGWGVTLSTNVADTANFLDISVNHP